MKSQSKKAFALLLVLGMCLALLPVSALAAPTDLSGASDAFNWYSEGLPTEDAVYKAGDGTAEWDAETKTLTFTDATVGSRNGRISFPSNGNGTEISLVLKGDNVFEGSSIETGSCKVTVSGDGNLSLVMTSSSDGVYVGVSSGGGELIFAGTGTFSVSGSGNTPMQLYGGSVTINSGDVSLVTTNGFGKAIYLYRDAKLIVNGGSLTARADNATQYYSGAILCDDATNSLEINGGSVVVSSAQKGISLKNPLTIKGGAVVNASAKAQDAIGGAAITISENAKVTAVSESAAGLSGVVAIGGNAVVSADGGTYGISGMYGIKTVLSGSPRITAKGDASAFNLGSGINTTGYAVRVGAAKDGSDAAAWDRTTSFTQYRNIYKYAEIGLCSHPDVADDGDCTTAVVCTCGVTMTEAYDAHAVTDWTSNEDETCTADGTKYGFCTRCGTKVTATDEGSAHAHTMEYYAAAAATCAQTGNVAYWHCSECGKNYDAESGGNVIEDVVLAVDPTNHAGGTELRDASVPTCSDKGYTGDVWCLGCGTKLEDGEEISETDHAWGDVQYSWSEDGKSCKAVRVCGTDGSHTEEVSAVVTGKVTKEPTCTEKGETTYTAVFDVEWASQQTKTVADVQEKGHGEPELKNAKDATCTAEGYTGDRVCPDCGTVIEQGTATAKTAHTYQDGACSICGAADPDYEPVKPEESEPEESDSPQTGDYGMMWLWAALLLVSCGGVAAAVYGRKRKQAK